jgi:hypothetical protein
MVGCAKAPPKCAIETLILDENLLPEGTYAERLISPVSERPQESVAQTFYYAPDAVLHEVVNWRSTRAAKREYDLTVKSAFDVDNYMGPWDIPDGMFISSTAQNYYAACGVAHKVYQCRMVATYGEYSVFFRSYVSDKGITLPKVNELLQAIDERMAQCVE